MMAFGEGESWQASETTHPLHVFKERSWTISGLASAWRTDEGWLSMHSTRRWVQGVGTAGRGTYSASRMGALS